MMAQLMLLREIITSAFLLAGVVFGFLAGLGILRMPDFLTRIQASTKAGTLGVGCLVIAVAIWFGDFDVMVRAGLIVVFLFATAPVAAHLISRAAYFRGVPLWSGSVRDELRGKYDPHSHTLISRDDDDEDMPFVDTFEDQRRR